MLLEPTTAHLEPDERLEIMERSKQVQDALDAEAKAVAEITFTQALVLTFIDCEKGNATVSTLSRPLKRAVHTLTSVVNTLERMGLVKRTNRLKEDRRVFRLQVSATGSEAVQKLRQTTLPLPVGR